MHSKLNSANCLFFYTVPDMTSDKIKTATYAFQTVFGKQIVITRPNCANWEMKADSATRTLPLFFHFLWSFRHKFNKLKTCLWNAGNYRHKILRLSRVWPCNGFSIQSIILLKFKRNLYDEFLRNKKMQHMHSKLIGMHMLHMLRSFPFVFYCSDFRYESKGIFVLGVRFFFFRQISTF